jgi:hypothetical protein
MVALPAVALAVLLAAPAPAPGESPRPSEADLFGGAVTTPVEPLADPPVAPSEAPEARRRGAAEPVPDARGDALLGGPARQAPDGRWDAAKEDPLKVGGLLYLRASTSAQRGVAPAAWPLSSPNLLNVFLDARPNDRVRGFALGRLTYDPTIPAQAPGLLGGPVSQAQTRAVLDQLYVNFDVARTVFVTAGRQHVKWGTGKLWNPTDFLHPARRDPLSQYDDRAGVTMVKAHLPWEARGWNLYGVALLDDLAGQSTRAGQVATPGEVGALGHVGGAARAELVLGGIEVAADVAAQRGHTPRFGLDTSFALGDLDLHAELALTRGRDAPYWRLTGADAGDPGSWTRGALGTTPQVVAGAEWSWQYSDQDALTVGAEYFFNDAGYADGHAYPVLLFSPNLPADTAGRIALGGSVDPRAAFTPFYLGRHYAGAYLALPRPGRWNDTTFTLSALANLSDGSGLVRLDHAVVLNTYLTLETFLAGHLGTRGGEFRFGITLPERPVAGMTLGLELPTPLVDAGVALRVRL